MIKQRSKIYEFLSGQSCGGAHNVLGQCAGGLVCLVKVPEDVENFREAEINAVGKCVTESSPECPRSTDKEKKKNVNCRPGQIGILAEALYCPKLNELKKPTREGKLPTLLEVLGSGRPFIGKKK